MDEVACLCTHCGARYRIAARLAGRTAKCKKCGNPFAIPKADDDEPGLPMQQPVPEQAAQNLFDIKPPEDFQQTQHEAPAGPLLPPILVEAILPLLILIATCVTLGMTLIPRAAHSSNPLLAYGLIAFALIFFIVITIPLTLRAVDSSAKTSDYELPNAYALQTIAAISVPLAAMVWGFFATGVVGGVMGGIVGLVVMGLLMAVMFRASVSGAVLTTLFASIWFAVGSAGVAAVTGILIFGLQFQWAMPWQPASVPQVAKAPAAPVAPAPVKPVTPAPAPAPAPGARGGGRPAAGSAKGRSAQTGRAGGAALARGGRSGTHFGRQVDTGLTSDSRSETRCARRSQ